MPSQRLICHSAPGSLSYKDTNFRHDGGSPYDPLTSQILHLLLGPHRGEGGASVSEIWVIIVFTVVEISINCFHCTIGNRFTLLKDLTKVLLSDV